MLFAFSFKYEMRYTLPLKTLELVQTRNFNHNQVVSEEVVSKRLLQSDTQFKK